MLRPHAIIAGVNKCGTTSVFRYLADHPDVCPSSVKETRFFSDPSRTRNVKSYEDYCAYFMHCSGDEKCWLEASPDYFSSGAEVASGIRNMLPEARIIVLMRDPVMRLISYYKSALVYDNYANTLIAGLSFSQFVDMALDAEESKDVAEPRSVEFRRALRQGCYGRDLREFGAVFSPDQCSYFFFEDLASDARKVMTDISRFLGLETGFFETYEFRVENKTRDYRSPLLHRIGFKMNAWLEPFFNKHPGLRRTGQKVYRALNERSTPDQQRIDRKACERLEEFYGRDKDELKKALAGQLGGRRLPAWLH